MTRERWALIMIGAAIGATLSVAIVGVDHQPAQQRPALCAAA